MPSIESSLSGRVAEVFVQPGDRVAPGDALMTVESMKMEIPLETEVGGVVAQVLLAPGEEVAEGQTAVILE